MSIFNWWIILYRNTESVNMISFGVKSAFTSISCELLQCTGAVCYSLERQQHRVDHIRELAWTTKPTGPIWIMQKAVFKAEKLWVRLSFTIIDWDCNESNELELNSSICKRNTIGCFFKRGRCFSTALSFCFSSDYTYQIKMHISKNITGSWKAFSISPGSDLWTSSKHLRFLHHLVLSSCDQIDVNTSL